MPTENKTKILFLIDDDTDDQEIFVSALEEVDKSVICTIANDGEEGLQQLISRSVFPDLIFLDINMPRMNGIQFLNKIKQMEEFKHIPVVIYSTTADPKFVKETKALGALDFITKPTHFSDLCQILESTLKTFNVVPAKG